VYACTGGAAFQSWRERTLGGRPASAEAADAPVEPAEPVDVFGLMLEGENVPSQAGFGEKIGEIDGPITGVAVGADSV